MKAPTEAPNLELLEDVVVIRTHGYLDEVYGAKVARTFNDHFDLGKRKFVFDLGDTKLMSTIGASVLIGILEILHKNNGSMAFCSCNFVIKKTLGIMGISKFAKIYDNCEEAAESMN